MVKKSPIDYTTGFENESKNVHDLNVHVSDWLVLLFGSTSLFIRIWDHDIF